MEFDNIRVEKKDHIALVTIDPPRQMPGFWSPCAISKVLRSTIQAFVENETGPFIDADHTDVFLRRRF
jgi:hypothetical protein